MKLIIFQHIRSHSCGVIVVTAPYCVTSIKTCLGRNSSSFLLIAQLLQSSVISLPGCLMNSVASNEYTMFSNTFLGLQDLTITVDTLSSVGPFSLQNTLCAKLSCSSYSYITVTSDTWLNSLSPMSSFNTHMRMSATERKCYNGFSSILPVKLSSSCHNLCLILFCLFLFLTLCTLCHFRHS